MLQPDETECRPPAVILDRLGIALPVIQAPMAGVQDQRLALAVADAGGLGSVPCAMLELGQLEAVLRTTLTGTAHPINLNFFCHAMPAPDPVRERTWLSLLAPYYHQAGLDPEAAPRSGTVRRPIDAAVVELLDAFRPRVMSFHFGLPEPGLLQRIRSWGTTVLASATSVKEGQWLQAQGVDAVIAQGVEAGGHRGDFLPVARDSQAHTCTLALVHALVRALDVPIVAAGGIANAADAAATRVAGAIAVQVGTAYLLCPEATTSAVHRDALHDPHRRQTTHTNLFSGRAARGIVNRLMRELGPMRNDIPAFPLASTALAPLRAQAEAAGCGDFSPLWAGTALAACRALPAAQVTRTLAGV